MKIAIFGGGFGLYGYLPAVVACGHRPVLPMRYREFLESRDDIRSFADQAEWVPDKDTLLRRCDGAVIAVPPAEQPHLTEECLAHDNIRYLFLEKPLAATPFLADALLDRLEGARRIFRIGYNFRYTRWGRGLLQNGRGVRSVDWHFRAHHYAQDIQTWKRKSAQGGGALRFYGIHLVALLAELGYDSVALSEICSTRSGEIETWRADIAGPALPMCRIVVACDAAEPVFTLCDGSGRTISLSDPYGETTIEPEADRRLSFLIDMLRDAVEDPTPFYAWYRKANKLWADLESEAIRA
ncbi:MAG: Gfo/Idh/MocA family oxidoreductase [Alphaproteobacteria bacterium]|nr:Gfo/Idh/MocA family oxidoreductase [Alphaproteobacteria bacterium]